MRIELPKVFVFDIDDTLYLERDYVHSGFQAVGAWFQQEFEIDKFAGGTMRIAEAVAAAKAITIIGGGDSIAAVTRAGVSSKITHISTGGGASLEYLAFGTLPGIDALK